MELWIRSQDRRILQKVDNIYLNANYDNKRICSFIDGDEMELGTYETKERALEVLDEIQQNIETQEENYLLSDENGIITGQKYYGYIYQMPID